MGQYSRRIKKGLRFYYSGQYLGTKYFSKAIYHTKKECKDAERNKINELDERARKNTQEVSLVDLMNERLDLIELKKSKKYYDENHLYFERLKDLTGDINISQVTRQQINQVLMDFSKDLAKRGKTNHKVNAMIRCFKALFNYGIDLYDLDMKNPVRGVKFYPVDINLKYIPTDAEIEAVKAKCDERQKLLIDFCRETGGRINEALRLKKSDIGETALVLYTRKAKDSNLTPRKIPIPLCLKGKKFKQERIFPYWTGNPKFLERKVRSLKQHPWGFHNLRHKYASELSRRGVPLFEIMSLLGHSSLKTTQNYLQLLANL